MNYKDIVNTFKYDEEEKRLFDYIGIYSEKIDNWLRNNKLNKNQLLKYMLVGFFLDYRACNHQGVTFNTKEESITEFENSIKEIDNLIEQIAQNKIMDNNQNSFFKDKFIIRQNKCKIFNKYYGNTIESTQEYLSLLNLNEHTKNLGLELYEYVIKNI